MMEMPSPMLPLSKEQIRALPAFQNLAPENIVIIQTLEQCLAIQTELYATTIFGFDTESKPTFIVDEKSTGPHLIQLASHEKAYLFQVNVEILNFLKPLLESEQHIKVGFGLKNDAIIFRQKGIAAKQLIDLAKNFSSFGYNAQVGVQTAVALLFQRYFAKNKKISTSNWAAKQLSPQQIYYASADAYAALLVFEQLAMQQLLSAQLQQQIHPILEVSTSKT